MWVHQTNWQKEMLTKYGNTMTLIDATYKTTLYDLALFFVTVRTNAGYIVAAEFIIQTETNEQIEEALNILKSWNPDWSPRYFMSDYSEAEILGIESAFPATFIYAIFIVSKAGNGGSKTINMDLPRMRVKVYLTSFVPVQILHLHLHMKASNMTTTISRH